MTHPASPLLPDGLLGLPGLPDLARAADPARLDRRQAPNRRRERVRRGRATGLAPSLAPSLVLGVLRAAEAAGALPPPAGRTSAARPRRAATARGRCRRTMPPDFESRRFHRWIAARLEGSS
jgi:hypothetical protein